MVCFSLFSHPINSVSLESKQSSYLCRKTGRLLHEGDGEEVCDTMMPHISIIMILRYDDYDIQKKESNGEFI